MAIARTSASWLGTILLAGQEVPLRGHVSYPTYQVRHHLLHVLCALFHFVLRPPELDNITFLCWVWKVDHDLEGTARRGRHGPHGHMQSGTCWWAQVRVESPLTSGNLSRISRIRSPFCPMIVR